MKTYPVLLSVYDVTTLTALRKKLGAKKLRIARVSLEWINRQCFSMERQAIYAKNVKGKLKKFIFSHGQTWEVKPQICVLPVTVAIAIPYGQKMPRESWYYKPIDGKVTLAQFLEGAAVTTLVAA